MTDIIKQKASITAQRNMTGIASNSFVRPTPIGKPQPIRHTIKHVPLIQTRSAPAPAPEFIGFRTAKNK